MSFINDMFGDMFSAKASPESLSEVLNRRVGNVGALIHHDHNVDHVKYFSASKIPLRVIQFTTPWSVHAALRFLGEAYITDQACVPQAVGKDLPILIDGNHICSSTMSILQHLYHYKHHEGGDDVLAAYIFLHLLSPISRVGSSALLRTIETHGAFGLRWNIARHMVKQIEARPCYTSEWSTERLHSHFISTYQRVSATLQMQPYLHGVSPGMSDALLFEHVAVAMTDEVLRAKLQEYPHIVAHYKSICTDYFCEFDWESCGYDSGILQKRGQLKFVPHKTAPHDETDNELVARTECICVKRFALSNAPIDDLEVASISYRGALFLAAVLGSIIVKMTIMNKN